MSGKIEQIRAAHLSARPDPTVNPAWANAEHDIGVLLSEIDRLREALEFYQDGPDSPSLSAVYVEAMQDDGMSF